jgi:hypothetical protein
MSERELHGTPNRLVPDEPLPPYSYVTGKFPHPTRDPAGHSFGQPPDDPPPLDPDEWSRSRHYLLGCDLFNHGYYWEAHEAWEAVWKACGRRGTAADFLKGLIKLAAAGVKAREGRPAGIARHGARAARLFRGLFSQNSGATYLGLDVGELLEFAEWLEHGMQPIESSDAAVKVVFDYQLRPEV